MESWILLVFSLCFVCTMCQKSNGTGLCSKMNNTIECCIGYMLVGDKCEECEPGFTGKNCSLTCGHGYYGRQCNERCRCSPDMHCDPILGCMSNTTSVNCTDPDNIDNIVPSLVFALAVLIICIICIRMLYAKIMRKRKELQSTQKVSTADNPAPYLEAEL